MSYTINAVATFPKLFYLHFSKHTNRNLFSFIVVKNCEVKVFMRWTFCNPRVNFVELFEVSGIELMRDLGNERRRHFSYPFPFNTFKKRVSFNFS
jgi:hypothetical protein